MDKHAELAAQPPNPQSKLSPNLILSVVLLLIGQYLFHLVFIGIMQLVYKLTGWESEVFNGFAGNFIPLIWLGITFGYWVEKRYPNQLVYRKLKQISLVFCFIFTFMGLFSIDNRGLAWNIIVNVLKLGIVAIYYIIFYYAVFVTIKTTQKKLKNYLIDSASLESKPKIIPSAALLVIFQVLVTGIFFCVAILLSIVTGWKSYQLMYIFSAYLALMVVGIIFGWQTEKKYPAQCPKDKLRLIVFSQSIAMVVINIVILWYAKLMDIGALVVVIGWPLNYLLLIFSVYLAMKVFKWQRHKDQAMNNNSAN